MNHKNVFWIIFTMLLLIFFMSCKHIQECSRSDGTLVRCVEPPDDVKQSKFAVSADVAADEILKKLQANIDVKSEYIRIRDDHPNSLFALQVIDYRLCFSFCNGVLTKEQYYNIWGRMFSAFIGSDSIEVKSDLGTKNKNQNEKPYDLINIIKNKQKDNVKESYGEFASQCFTDEDLKDFKNKKITEKIVQELKNSHQFIQLVSEIRDMPERLKDNLLEEGLITYKQTWAQLGKISRDGQTEAGQQAEKMISESIIELIKKLLDLSNDEFKKLPKD